MPVHARVPRRSDALRNRDAILGAARELFAESADFPMSELACRAGVGRGTVYRNFPDRSHLALAVMADDINNFEKMVSSHPPDDPDALFRVLQAMAEPLMRYNPLQELGRRDGGVDSAAEQLRERFCVLMAGPLRAAKAAGAVRPDLTVDDLVLLTWMIRGATLISRGSVSRAAIVSRAVSLALDGVAPFRRRS
jgi:AcrR family transcriptional regulator